MSTSPRLRLQVLDADATVGPHVREALTRAGMDLVAGGDAGATAGAECPDAVVLDASAVEGDLAAAVRDLLRRCPQCCVVVTGTAPAAPVLSHAVTAGARGFLLKPYAPADLVTTIRDVYDSSAATATPAVRRGWIVAVYSPKGGCGRTTIATNLAVALAQRPDTSVAIVDLSLQFGDVGTVLDLRSESSILDLLGRDRLDAAVIDSTFVRHASGVRVLLAPPDLAAVQQIEPEQVERLLERLRSHFDVIVCDLWTSLEDLTARVLRVADRVVLVASPDLPSARNLMRVLETTETELGLADRLVVIANRFPETGGLTKDELEEMLGHPLAGAVPNDRSTMLVAVNRGIPVFMAKPNSAVARSYRALAELIAPPRGSASAARPAGQARTDHP